MTKVNSKTLIILAVITLVVGSFATLGKVIACVSVTDQYGNTGGCAIQNVYTDKSVAFTRVATNKTLTAATLNASYVASDMNDQSCQAFFDISTDRNSPKRIALGPLYKNNTVTNFSKRLTDLQPNTTYFYRAAVACNNNGMRYGETVAFKTTPVVVKAQAKKVTYTAPAKKVSYVAPTRNVSGKTVVTCDCADKFLSLSVENLDMTAQTGRQNNFRVFFKSLENENLENITLKINVGEGMKIVGASAGDFAEGGQELLLNLPNLRKDEAVEIFFTTITAPTAKSGDKLMINAKANYTATGAVKNGNVFAGETKAYSLIMVDNSQIRETNVTGGTRENTTVNATNNSLMPNTLLEWLIALLVVSIFLAAVRYFITAFREMR